MDITQEKIDDLNSRLKVTIAASDYKDNYTKTLKEYSKQMTLPGFRAGKVPSGVVKKKYGRGILADELQKILDRSIHDYISKNDLKVLGQPLPVKEADQGDWENPDDFHFTYDIGLAPDFKVELSDKHKVTRYTVKIDKKMINEEVDRIRRRYGALSDSDKVGETDMILGDFTELREDGLPNDDGVKNSSTIGMEYIEDKKSKKKLLGLKVGDVVEVEPEKLSHSHEDMGRMLGISHEEIHALGRARFSLKINEIKSLSPAELNEEFFGKVLPEGVEKNEESLKKHISEGLEKHFAKDSDQLFRRDANRYLSDKLKLQLPDDFLKRWISVSSEGKTSAEEVEAGYADYSNSIKWQLIKNRIISENEIKIEFDDAIEHTMNVLKDNYTQYGMPAPADEEIRKTAMGYLQDREQLEQIFEGLYEEKVMDVISNTIKVTDKEVSFDKFKDIATK